jgi:hypothetical protein
MEMKNEKILAGLLIICLIIIIVLSVLLVNCHNKSEKYQSCGNDNKSKFCSTCQGIGRKVCPDRELINKLYIDGTLTEDSNLIRSKEWPSLYFDKFNHYPEHDQEKCK